MEIVAESTKDRIVLKHTLTEDETMFARLAEYAAGRLLKESAVLAAERPDAGGLFICQDAASDASAHDLLRLFETFCASCDWWRERVDSVDGDQPQFGPDQMIMRPQKGKGYREVKRFAILMIAAMALCGVKTMTAVSTAKDMRPVKLTQNMADIRNIANDMRNWCDFKFGDPRLNQLGAKLVQRQNTYIQHMLNKPGMFLPNNPDVFSQVSDDAQRGSWMLNGRNLSVMKGNDPKAVAQRKQEVVNSLLNAVKSPNARKVISILMNQGNLADLEGGVFLRVPVLVGDADVQKMQSEEIHTIPGANMFVSHSGGGILADVMPSFGFEISKDGKTATVTVAIDKDIASSSAKYNEYKIGTVKITQKTKIDLTKDMPEVVDVTFSQTFTPDKIRFDPTQKPLSAI